MNEFITHNGDDPIFLDIVEAIDRLNLKYWGYKKHKMWNEAEDVARRISTSMDNLNKLFPVKLYVCFPLEPTIKHIELE